MTWDEIKKYLESHGVKDSDSISQIDLLFDDDPKQAADDLTDIEVEVDETGDLTIFNS